jgi:hypothetical protein
MTIAVVSLVLLAGSVPDSLAGTPLTCFPFDIGSARSLPWSTGTNRSDWNTPKADYDTRRLADDTIGLLGDRMPVIVRMETIRRAALYGRQNPAAAQDLLAKVKARALTGEKGKGNALYLFDYGYLLETYNQVSLFQGDKKGAGEHGYSHVLEAIALRGGDPEMEFAAALITVWPRQESHQEHFRKAVAGAAGDALLSDNLISHFPDRTASLKELRAGLPR